MPPRFTKVPIDQIGVSGGVVSFVCQASGDPKPRVSWNKKGKKVNSQRIEVSETVEIWEETLAADAAVDLSLACFVCFSQHSLAPLSHHNFSVLLLLVPLAVASKVVFSLAFFTHCFFFFSQIHPLNKYQSVLGLGPLSCQQYPCLRVCVCVLL